MFIGIQTGKNYCGDKFVTNPYVYFGTVLWVQKISGESAVKRQKAFPPLPLTTQWTEKRTVPWDGAFY